MNSNVYSDCIKAYFDNFVNKGIAYKRFYVYDRKFAYKIGYITFNGFGFEARAYPAKGQAVSFSDFFDAHDWIEEQFNNRIEYLRPLDVFYQRSKNKKSKR